ncbi:hypothetical protein [Thalassoroseus pseudoceratinae]|uniref:hypothetical protein n=1 Tax=Thalassoroseus pseudoceratinae TaxID=2713176 RepID=UPI001423D740|nr:hypothetical protein [Thalassoroseus pseudoceratinae]
MTGNDSSKSGLPQNAESTNRQTTGGWTWKTKLLASGLIAFHLCAVVLSPASTRPSSGLSQAGWDWFQPYIEVMYLDHGYRFFAPEPGPSTLIAYTVTTADGNEISGRIPDRETIWPRLLYHRYFMLTENMGSFAIPNGEEFLPLAPESYARHLCAKHDGETVGMTRITHWFPTMEQVRNGVTLTAPASYTEEPIGKFDREGKRLP